MPQIHGKPSPRPIDLKAAFAALTTHWDSHVAGELNGQCVKCVKILAEFVWHQHADEDELFLVLYRVLHLRLPDGLVKVRRGQFYIVARGVEHQPHAPKEAEIILFEPASTFNTGNVRNHFTKKTLKSAKQ